MRAQPLGFEIQTEETVKTKRTIAPDLAGGFSRELDQCVSFNLYYNFAFTRNEFEDFCVSGLEWARGGTLGVPLVTKNQMTITPDLTFPEKWELDQRA